MTQVNFYILNDDDNQKRLSFIYRLVKKSAKQNKKIILLCDESLLHSIDSLLWSESVEDFLIHDCLSLESELSQVNHQSTVVVAERSRLNDLTSIYQADRILDLSSSGEPIDTAHVLLVTNQHPDVLANARLKFQSYKQQGIIPKVYKM